MSDEILDVIVGAVDRPTRRSLERAMRELIDTGRLAPGTRLPTVRLVAERLGLSSASVGQGWRTLVDAGALTTHTKRGTTVLGPPRGAQALRYRQTAPSSSGFHRPVMTDRDLLPDFARAAAAALAQPGLHETDGTSITPQLRAAVQDSWGVGSEFLTTHSMLEGVEFVLRTLLRPGDRVAVEDPTTPRLLDILHAMRVRPVPIAVREGGPDVHRLNAALRAGARVFVYQPSLQTPTGRSVSPEWLAEVPALLNAHDAVALELVPTPFLHTSPLPTLAPGAPERVVAIHGFELAHGSDMRVAIVGGSRALIDTLGARAEISSRWVSRLLQGALAYQLTDPRALATIAHAGEVYLARTRALARAFKDTGLNVEGSGGTRIWLSVDDGTAVIEGLNRADRDRWHAHEGTPFKVVGGRRRHLAFHTATIDRDQQRIATTIDSLDRLARERRRAARRSADARSVTA